MLREVLALSLVLVFSMTFVSIGASQIGNPSGNMVSPKSIQINTPGTNNNPGGCEYYTQVSPAGDVNTLYVSSMILYAGSQPYIVYFAEEQSSVQSGSSQLIAGGNHINSAENPTWSAEDGFKWPAYCSNDASSPSNWPCTPSSIGKDFKPNNCISYGASSTTTITTAASAGATYEGLSGTVSYTYSVSFTAYAFYECPQGLFANQSCFKYTDDEGAFGGSQKAFTLYYVTEQPAISGDYMHIFPYSTAHYLVSCSVSGSWWLGYSYTPTYSTAYAAGGYNVYIPN